MYSGLDELGRPQGSLHPLQRFRRQLCGDQLDLRYRHSRFADPGSRQNQLTTRNEDLRLRYVRDWGFVSLKKLDVGKKRPTDGCV